MRPFALVFILGFLAQCQPLTCTCDRSFTVGGVVVSDIYTIQALGVPQAEASCLATMPNVQFCICTCV